MSKLVFKTIENVSRRQFDFNEFYRYLMMEYEYGVDLNKITYRYKSPDGYCLGKHLYNIRYNYIKLTEKEIELIENLGYDFNAKKYKSYFDFEKFIQKANEYLPKVNFDWTKIKEKAATEDGYLIGQKIASIRCGRQPISAEQKNILNEMGFVWKVRATEYTFNFEDFCKRLTQVLNENNNDWSKIKLTHKMQDGYPIGQKIHNLRRGNIKLSEQQIQTLTDIGFVWSEKNPDNKFVFDDFYERLKQKLEENNFNWVKMGKSLKNETYPMKAKIQQIRSGKISLTDEQKQWLDAIGFVWKVDSNFDYITFYNHIVKELNRHNGDWSKITQRYVCPDGYKLGNRIINIRGNSICLTEEQRQQLLNLGFKWKVRDIKFRFEFEDFLSRLLKAYEENGCKWRGLTKHVCSDGYPLGEKISSIGESNVKITSEQMQKLEEIGYPFKLGKTNSLDQ